MRLLTVEPHSGQLIFVTSCYWGNSLLTGIQTLWTEGIFFNQSLTNLIKLHLDFSTGAYHLRLGVLVHALLQVLPDLCIWVSLMRKAGNDVFSSFVLIENWLRHGAKCKAGKLSQVPWSDIAWDLTYESKYLFRISTSLWGEIINKQKWIILTGISIVFALLETLR